MGKGEPPLPPGPSPSSPPAATKTGVQQKGAGGSRGGEDGAKRGAVPGGKKKGGVVAVVAVALLAALAAYCLSAASSVNKGKEEGEQTGWATQIMGRAAGLLGLEREALPTKVKNCAVMNFLERDLPNYKNARKLRTSKQKPYLRFFAGDDLVEEVPITADMTQQQIRDLLRSRGIE
ncbi:hypothetical protein QOT17_011031 [Balamuthia mandrillaris]